jgi:hypothetical protein
VSRWRNGAGRKADIAAGPDWLVGYAWLDADAPFSDYAGYDRTITLIEGPGFILDFGPFPYCLSEGIGVMGYGSLGHGLLTGAFTAATTFDTARDWRGNGVAFGQPIFRGDNFRTNVGVVERIRREVAEPRGVTVSQIALAWVLGHPAISTALVGARTPAEVDANDAGVELELSPGERKTIEGILAGVADRVREFTPLQPAMQPWGEEIPAE